MNKSVVAVITVRRTSDGISADVEIMTETISETHGLLNVLSHALTLTLNKLNSGNNYEVVKQNITSNPP